LGPFSLIPVARGDFDIRGPRPTPNPPRPGSSRSFFYLWIFPRCTLPPPMGGWLVCPPPSLLQLYPPGISLSEHGCPPVGQAHRYLERLPVYNVLGRCLRDLFRFLTECSCSRLMSPPHGSFAAHSRVWRPHATRRPFFPLTLFQSQGAILLAHESKDTCPDGSSFFRTAPTSWSLLTVLFHFDDVAWSH